MCKYSQTPHVHYVHIKYNTVILEFTLHTRAPKLNVSTLVLLTVSSLAPPGLHTNLLCLKLQRLATFVTNLVQGQDLKRVKSWVKNHTEKIYNKLFIINEI